MWLLKSLDIIGKNRIHFNGTINDYVVIFYHDFLQFHQWFRSFPNFHSFQYFHKFIIFHLNYQQIILKIFRYSVQSFWN